MDNLKNIQQKHVFSRAELKSTDDETGSIEAAFSVFDVLDSDGDIVLSSAFKNGQQVAMVWGHNWGSRPIGKGTIRVESDRAILDGKFFLDTFDGSEAYKTVKNMGDLQEWSWGFKVKDYEIEEDDNSPFGYKRIIKDTEVYEVSPVLIGANRQTETLAIKSDSNELRELISSIVREELKTILSEESENESTEENTSLKNLTEEGIIYTEEEEESEKETHEDIQSKARREVAKYQVMRYEEVLH